MSEIQSLVRPFGQIEDTVILLERSITEPIC